tara:strand:+ start:11102 stop:11317 length:216 start_codon:yes stop_codon:yes gene_type:complete
MPDPTLAELKAKKAKQKQSVKDARKKARFDKKVAKAKGKESLYSLTGNKVKETKAQIRITNLQAKQSKKKM